MGIAGRLPLSNDVPDATTLLHFRHLLEEKGIGKLFFDAINRCLERAGRMMRGGSIVDATLISAPSSTKNAEKKRDPEMHSVKKGNQWHFGMKCRTGADAGSGFVHTVEATAANVHGVTAAARLLREDDKAVCGDSACLGIEKREEIKSNPQLSAIEYRINRRPGRFPRVSDNAIDWERYIENRKSAVRCKVEHPYRIVKNIWAVTGKARNSSPNMVLYWTFPLPSSVCLAFTCFHQCFLKYSSGLYSGA